MKFERNKNSKKYFLCCLMLVVVLTMTITFIGSKANYRMTASIPLTEGKVTASPNDINVMAIYIKDTNGYKELDKTETIPDIGYVLNETESYCCKGSGCKKENKDPNVTLKTIGGLHTFSGISKNDKCYLYFDLIDVDKPTTMSNLLENYYINKKIRLDGTFGNIISGEVKNTIYVASDGENNSYYFAGNPTDNWVEFGGYYWRIIRINGDGTIRMIYQGRTEDESGNKLKPKANGEETQIGSVKFNDQHKNNRFVGYWYGDNGELRGLKYPSTIYTELNTWFENSNIKKGTNYFNKIDLNAGFCGDREPSSSITEIDGIGGTGSTTTYYAASVRVSPGGANNVIYNKVKPSYNCLNNDDLYTYKEANQGNKVLANPIGMITADELSYAGLVYGKTNYNNYLCNKTTYASISPYYYNGAAAVFTIYDNAAIGAGSGSINLFALSIRPVINLRSDVQFTGDGTQSNPFKVIVS